jgi:hypothetical protein
LTQFDPYQHLADQMRWSRADAKQAVYEWVYMDKRPRGWPHTEWLAMMDPVMKAIIRLSQRVTVTAPSP